MSKSATCEGEQGRVIAGIGGLPGREIRLPRCAGFDKTGIGRQAAAAQAKRG
jgi:hypothetical protein